MDLGSSPVLYFWLKNNNKNIFIIMENIIFYKKSKQRQTVGVRWS